MVIVPVAAFEVVTPCTFDDVAPAAFDVAAAADGDVTCAVGGVTLMTAVVAAGVDIAAAAGFIVVCAFAEFFKTSDDVVEALQLLLAADAVPQTPTTVNAAKARAMGRA